MEKEINVKRLLLAVVRAWWVILIFTLVCALVATGYTVFLAKRQYRSTVMFYIVNTSSNYDYQSSTLLGAMESLANDYSNIAQSDKYWQESDVLTIIHEAGEKMEAKDEDHVAAKKILTGLTDRSARAMISFTYEESSILYVHATSENYLVANEIAVAIQKTLPAMVRDVTRPWIAENEGILSECLQTLNFPDGVTRVAPSHAKNILIGAAIGLVVSAALVVLRALFYGKVFNPDDLKEVLPDVPVLSGIPDWAK